MPLARDGISGALVSARPSISEGLAFFRDAAGELGLAVRSLVLVNDAGRDCFVEASHCQADQFGRIR